MRDSSPKVVLISPPLTLEDRYGKDMKHFGALSEPLGLAYLAGMLQTFGVVVEIIDAPAENLDTASTVAKLKHLGAELVGISLLTPSFGVVKDLCGRIRSAAPDLTIILGGPHCTALPEQTLEEIGSADLVCFGEGEKTLKEVVSSFREGEFGRIPGLCYRDKQGRIIKNEPRPYIRDLDDLPMPARELLPVGRYHLTASRVADSSYCPTIIVARGCPFGCSYCSHSFGRKIRFHSVERILHEIRLLINTYGITQLNIEADTLTANKTFVTRLCRELIESGISRKVKWTCESRVDTVTSEILQLMKEAGCWQISYGIETGSQRLLKMINKGITLEQIEETVKATHQAGISIRGFFMLGLPEETIADSRKTIDFAIKLNPRWAQFTITIPYPGTPMFEHLDREGKILHYDWKEYNTWSGWKTDSRIPYVAEGRTLDELVAMQKYALRRFYLRLSPFLRFLMSVRSPADLKKYATGVWVLVKSWLPG